MAFLRILVLTMVAIATIVNFVKAPPPSSYNQKPQEYSSQSVDDVRSTAGDSVKDASKKRKCPCPTEIEKMDCDEGICSVVAIITGQRHKIFYTGHRNIHTKKSIDQTNKHSPDPRPPRLFI